MSEAARRNELLDRIQAGSGGGASVRELYAARPIGELEAAAARIDAARANADKPGGRLGALWDQGRFTVIE